MIDGEWLEDKTAHPVVRYAKEHENLLISPHVGGACFEAQLSALENTLEKVRHFVMSGYACRGTEVLARSLMNSPVAE